MDRLEAMWAHGVVAMGLVASADEATRNRPHTPKLAFQSYSARRLMVDEVFSAPQIEEGESSLEA